MGKAMSNFQEKIKNSSSGVFLFTLKLFTGLLLGLTISLIGQEIFSYNSFLFAFVIVVFAGLFMRESRNWKWVAVLVFNLICVLVAMLLRMYILIAPGA